jgi:hypothetical protein
LASEAPGWHVQLASASLKPPPKTVLADRRADDLNAEPGRVREQNVAPIAAIMQLQY